MNLAAKNTGEVFRAFWAGGNVMIFKLAKLSPFGLGGRLDSC
jgi:hypothetical protein